MATTNEIRKKFMMQRDTFSNNLLYVCETSWKAIILRIYIYMEYYIGPLNAGHRGAYTHTETNQKNLKITIR